MDYWRTTERGGEVVLRRENASSYDFATAQQIAANLDNVSEDDLVSIVRADEGPGGWWEPSRSAC
jgi:hypothetical protein